MPKYSLPANIDADIAKLESLIADFKGGKITAAELKAHRVPFGVYEQREADTYMVRVRCPGGCITPEQLECVADLSNKYSNGTLHITTRQEVQIHYVKLDDVISVMKELRKYDLAARGGGGNTVRNILSDERAGISNSEAFDVTPYTIELTDRLIAEEDSWTLPRKLKISFSGSQEDSALATVADLGFIATIKDGKRGFKVYVAGGFGSKPQVGQLYHEFLPQEEVYNFAEAVKQLFWKFGNRKNKHAARLRYLWRTLGEDEFRNKLEAEYKIVKEKSYPPFQVKELSVDLKSPQFEKVVTDGAYQTWKSRFVLTQKQAGLYQVIVPVELGFITGDKIKELASFLDQLGDDVLRFTKDQNIVLRNIKEEYLSVVYNNLKSIQSEFNRPFILDHIVACAGASTCKLGFCLSRGAATAITRQLESDDLDLDRLNNLRINISGCPNSCGQHPIADIGFFGRAGRSGEHMYPKYVVVAGAIIADGETKYASSIGDISARDLPKFLSEVLADYLDSNLKSFNEYLEDGGKDFIESLLADYDDIPLFEDDKNYYFDWGASELFSVAGRSQGECSAGLFDLIDVDIANVKGRLEKLNTTSDQNEQLAVLKELVFYASRTLLITRGIQPKSEQEAFDNFEQQFISSGIVNDSFMKLLLTAKEGRVGLDDKAQVVDLCNTVEELYEGMDNAFQFKVKPSQPEDEKEPEVKEDTQGVLKDLRGVACPMNFVKTKMELSRIKSGEILVIWLDEGAPIENVPGSVRSEGHEVLKQEKIDEYWSVTIKKK